METLGSTFVPSEERVIGRRKVVYYDMYDRIKWEESLNSEQKQFTWYWKWNQDIDKSIHYFVCPLSLSIHIRYRGRD